MKIRQYNNIQHHLGLKNRGVDNILYPQFIHNIPCKYVHILYKIIYFPLTFITCIYCRSILLYVFPLSMPVDMQLFCHSLKKTVLKIQGPLVTCLIISPCAIMLQWIKSDSPVWATSLESSSMCNLSQKPNSRSAWMFLSNFLNFQFFCYKTQNLVQFKWSTVTDRG